MTEEGGALGANVQTASEGTVVVALDMVHICA